MGAIRVRVGSTDWFQPGVLVGVGMDQDRTFEVKRVLEVVRDTAGRWSPAVGERLCAARYRWAA